MARSSHDVLLSKFDLISSECFTNKINKDCYNKYNCLICAFSVCYNNLGDVDCETSGGAGGGGPSGFKALGALLEEGWVRFDDLRT